MIYDADIQSVKHFLKMCKLLYVLFNIRIFLAKVFIFPPIECFRLVSACWDYVWCYLQFLKHNDKENILLRIYVVEIF